MVTLRPTVQLISRTTYADLFAAIGTTFGVGDGSTTFGIPDLRGEFARGWDDARGVDTGRTFGSAQAEDFKAHTHLGRVMTTTGGSGDAKRS
jgi:phage-related tail fiber protein